jgi:tetratricopeptide (TPR) repeat protein
MLTAICRYFVPLTLVLFTFMMPAQQKIDSLQKVLANQKEDSSKVKTLWNLSVLSRSGSNEAAMTYAVKALELARQINFERAIGASYFLLGETYSQHGDFTHGIEMFQKAIDASKDTIIIVRSMNGIANAYQYSGNLNESYIWNTKCLALAQRSGIKAMIASSLGNIGSTYLFLSQTGKALDYYLQARTIFEELGNYLGLSACYANIGVIYDGMNDLDKAMEYNQKSLEIDLKTGKIDGLAANYGNIAILYNKKKKYKEAYEAHRKSLSYYKKINYKLESAREMLNIYNLHYTLYDSIYTGKEKEKNYKALMDSLRELMPTLIQANDKAFGTILLSTLAGIQIRLKSFDKAVNNLNLGLQFAKEIKAKNRELEFYDLFVFLYNKKKDFKKALQYQQKYTEEYKKYKEAMIAEDVQGKEMLFSFNKKVMADSLKNDAEKKLKDEEIKTGQLKLQQEKIIEYALFGGLAIVLVFSFLLFKRFKITSKQKEIIEEQKKLVERKQKEVLDSIHYAKRIQIAQIPTEKRFASLLNKLRR